MIKNTILYAVILQICMRKFFVIQIYFYKTTNGKCLTNPLFFRMHRCLCGVVFSSNIYWNHTDNRVLNR